VLLPALLVTFEHGKNEQISGSAPIRHYDDSYYEEDDDMDQNLQRLSVERAKPVKTV